MQRCASPLPNQTLQGSPAVLDRWRHVGLVGVFVDFDRDPDDSFPRELRLEEPHADEMSVEDGRDERVAEHESPNDNASEN